MTTPEHHQETEYTEEAEAETIKEYGPLVPPVKETRVTKTTYYTREERDRDTFVLLLIISSVIGTGAVVIIKFTGLDAHIPFQVEYVGIFIAVAILTAGAVDN